MKDRAILLVIACLPLACGPGRGDSEAATPSKTKPEPTSKAEPAPPTKAGDEKTKPAPPPLDPAPPAKRERWRTTAEDAKAAGLPPVAFSFDTTDSGMSGSGSSDGDYVTLSGPPGGPLMLRIAPATVGADPAALVRRGSASVTAEEVELLGAKRRAVAWITGEGLARTSWCGIVVAPTGAAEGAAALLVELGVGHGGEEITCKTAVEHHVLGPVVKSLVFE